MFSLPYPSSLQRYPLQQLQTTTTRPSIGMPSVPETIDSAQTLLAMLSPSITNGSEESDSPTWSESPESAVSVATPLPAIPSPTLSNMNSLAEIITQTANQPTSGNSLRAASPKTPRIKRPMNAFMVWSQQRRQQISASGQKFHNSDISKMLGAEWRGMEEQEKIPFVDRAKQLREEHFREYPDYVYRPRRRKRVGRSTGSVDSANEEAVVPPAAASMLFTPLNLLTFYMKVTETINAFSAEASAGHD